MSFATSGPGRERTSTGRSRGANGPGTEMPTRENGRTPTHAVGRRVLAGGARTPERQHRPESKDERRVPRAEGGEATEMTTSNPHNPQPTTHNPQPVTHNSGDTIRRDSCGPCIAAGRTQMGVSVHDSPDKFGDDGFGAVLIPSPRGDSPRAGPARDAPALGPTGRVAARGPTPPVPPTVVRAGLRPTADPL